MAEFQEQVMGLTGLTIDAGSTNPSRAEFTTFLTDGAKEIINILPPKLKEKCASISIVNATNGTTLDMDAGGEILQVTRLSADSGGYQIPCRNIHPMYGDLANDSGSLHYATVTDPAYWITSNSSGVSTLFVKPTATDAQPSNVYRVAYPTVAYNDAVIANFPNEAEYLVTLYAAIKSLQSTMAAMNSVTAIDTTSFDAITDAVGQAELAAAKFVSASSDSQFETDVVWDAANSQLKRVKDALDNAEKIIDDGANSPTGNAAGDAATYLYTEEDSELLQGALAIAASEINRAQAHIAEWVSIGDMRVKEIQAALAEANGYVSEAKIRMERESQKYQWYQAQQLKLQQDYDKGIQMLVSGGIPKPAREERRR